MNYLAHSYLSCDNEDLLVGNLITDLIRKKDEIAYDAEIRKGIDLHRLIDTYTDKQDLVLDSLDIFYPTQGKYAPVVMDIVWDYYLSKNWKRYSGEKLEDFTSNTCALLEKNYHRLQDKVVTRFERMIQHDFLNSCNGLERLHSTFVHLTKRVRFESNLLRVSEIVEKNDKQLNDSFNQLFPKMISYVETNCVY